MELGLCKRTLWIHKQEPPKIHLLVSIVGYVPEFGGSSDRNFDIHWPDSAEEVVVSVSRNDSSGAFAGAISSHLSIVPGCMASKPDALALPKNL